MVVYGLEARDLGFVEMQRGSGYILPPFINKPNIETGVHALWYHAFSPIHHYPSVHNEEMALQHRVLKKGPDVDDLTMQHFVGWVKSNLRKILPVVKIDSHSYSTYIRRSNARPSVKRILKRTKVEMDKRAVDENGGLNHEQVRSATKRSAFVKNENLLKKNNGVGPDGAPRMIQGADPVFINLVGPWMMAFQDYVMKVWNKDNWLCFSSGLSGEQIGKWGNGIFASILENDISRWDSSVCRQLLLLEHWIFDQFGCPEMVSELIRNNVSTRGLTHGGIKYWASAGRKSGDPYTSVGNSILNVLIHLYILTDRGTIPLRNVRYTSKMIVQGDDNVTMHNRNMDFSLWRQVFEELGFKAVTIARKSLDETEFCSSRFMPTVNGYILVPKFGRVLAKLGSFCNPPKGVDTQAMLKGVVLGLWNAMSFLPSIRQLFEKILEKTRNVKALRLRTGDWNAVVRKPIQIDPIISSWLSRTYYDDFSPLKGKLIEPVNIHYLSLMEIDHSEEKWHWTVAA